MLKGGKGKHSLQRVPSVSPTRFEERQAFLDKIAAEMPQDKPKILMRLKL